MQTRVPVVVMMLLVAGCSSGGNNATPNSGQSSAPATVTTTPDGTQSSAPATTAGGTSAIKIANFAYDPNSLTVKPGQKIAVTNTDSTLHTVTSDLAGLFLADDVKAGNPVTFTAPTRAGTYTFHCQYHPTRMQGTLVVKS